MIQSKRVFVMTIIALGFAMLPRASVADAAGEIRDRTQIVIVPVAETQRLLERDGRGGYARISAIVEDERGNRLPVIVAHAGNALSPSFFSAIDEGAHAIDALNRLGVTIMSPGHREFDFGPEVAARRFAEARFPIVLTNMLRSDGSVFPGTARWRILDVAGYRLGFMGLVSEALMETTTTGDVEISEPIDAATTTARQMREAGADVVVALADLDRGQIARLRAAKAADIVIVSQAGAQETEFRIEGSAKDIALSVTEGGDRIPVIDLHLHRLARETMALPAPGADGQIDPDTIDPERFFESTAQILVTEWRSDIRLRDTARIEPDPFADTIIAQHYAVLSVRLNRVLATVGYPFDTERASLESNENAFANFVTDTMRERTGADIAFINSGVFRPDRAYARDEPYTYRDLLTALPVRSRIVTFTLTGRRLAGLFEHSIADNGIGTPRFLQVAGMSILYDPDRRPGERICQFLVGSTPLQRGASYTVATTDFLARGAGYEHLEHAGAAARDQGDLIDLLVTHLKETGLIEPLKDARIAPAC